MEKDSHERGNNNSSNSGSTSNARGGDGLLRSSSETITRQATTTTTSDFVLQWGSRKRLRCMKVQAKDDSTAAPVNRTTVRVDRRVVRADKEMSNQPNTISNTTHGDGYLNLRQRPSSPPLHPPSHQRLLRNSENSSAMRGQSNGGVRGISSPDKAAYDKRGGTNNHHNNGHHNPDNNNKSGASSETAHDAKKGGSSSGSGEAAPPPPPPPPPPLPPAPPVWPPKFMIALTNKEKEEDFFAFKGSKLPQRPKKRAKFIQRTLNLVSPGAWLCDLTLERYEVREKKISKKRPRGLKAMGKMESDSD